MSIARESPPWERKKNVESAPTRISDIVKKVMDDGAFYNLASRLKDCGFDSKPRQTFVRWICSVSRYLNKGWEVSK